ncbi:MAG: aspartate kinase [Bacteroidota bacterium]|nr:aspartate kinase [Bacteroidota bacterium]
MHVHKFGGASIKDAESIKNLSTIIQDQKRPVIIVISAMGKTTNALENLAEAYYTRESAQAEAMFEKIKQFHEQVYLDLGLEKYGKETAPFSEVFDTLKQKLQTAPSLNYDYEYDQIVHCGELFSSLIINTWLQHKGIDVHWVDARDIIRTDSAYRAANVNWKTSKKAFDRQHVHSNRIMLTQGFIGSTPEGISTTLGREGSDYTAAILAVLSVAKDVTIWKDVPGVMNADPKHHDFSEKMPLISYQEAIELAYYGAKIIHPRTIKPLENKKIPLYVKSFLEPGEKGTEIKHLEKEIKLSPVYIIKNEQVLLSVSPRDFSFIMEKHISRIFDVFDMYNAHVSMSQNSAISYSICVDCHKRKLPKLIARLGKEFKVLYNEHLQLITIRHYTNEAIEKMLKGKHVVLEQRSRKTARFLVENTDQVQ